MVVDSDTLIFGPNAELSVLGILEVLLVFRFFLKLLGASAESTFVSFVYTLSGIFFAPFNSIFSSVVSKGIETDSVLEPANIIAMIIYALIAYAVVKMIKIYAIPKDK